VELPELVPIEYRGNLVALVSTRRVHIVARWLLTRPTGDPELRFVAYMCLCCAEVLGGRLPGPYTDALGQEWARHAISGDASAVDTVTAELESPTATASDGDQRGARPDGDGGREPHRGRDG
jgi:hypothetical protein